MCGIFTYYITLYLSPSSKTLFLFTISLPGAICICKFDYFGYRSQTKEYQKSQNINQNLPKLMFIHTKFTIAMEIKVVQASYVYTPKFTIAMENHISHLAQLLVINSQTSEAT